MTTPNNTVAGLPAKWRAQADALDSRTALPNTSSYYRRQCADELEAALASPAPSAGVGDAVKSLREIRDLIASRPPECLGIGRAWPIRDEITHNLDRIIAALQHPAAPSVPPGNDVAEVREANAVEDGLPTLAERLERVVEAMRKDDEAVVWWITEVADVVALIRRLATTEQPECVVWQGTTSRLESAYFGEWSAARAWAGLNGHVTRQVVRGRSELKAVTTPPPAPAAEQGAKDWFCATCSNTVDPSAVTFDERHDSRVGGCGMPVTYGIPVRAEQPEGKWKLPCDVRLPPATTITAGCNLSTLIHAMECRKEAGVVHFPPKVQKDEPNGN